MEPVQEALKLYERLGEIDAQNKLSVAYSRRWCDLTEDEQQYSIENKIQLGVYDWAIDFHQAGKTYKERCLMCGNRTGKSATATAEDAMHALGWYPPWWEGRRFDKPVKIWVGAESTEAIRETVQLHLLGEPFGTGWIPKNAIHPKGPLLRKSAGVSGVVDMVKIKHASGGWSTLSFKTYEQGRQKWQGSGCDIVHFDEEPPQPIFTEGLTRTLDKRGLVYLSYTPLMGHSDVSTYFIESDPKRVCMISVTWDDAPHLTEQDKKDLYDSLPEHEREARSKGKPMMGVGAVFPVTDESIACDAFDIPAHWRRICGLDFGLDHPTAAVWLAHDTQTDTVYVYDCYKEAGKDPPYHAGIIRQRSDWIPAAWPHDGLRRLGGADGKRIADVYRDLGVEMLGSHAKWRDDDTDKPTLESGIMDMIGRMRSGRLKIFKHLTPWFTEKHYYHRNDHNKIVDKRDDLLSATRYGLIMLRYAVSRAELSNFSNADTAGMGNYKPMEL